MDSTLIFGLIVGLLGFTIAGYLSKAKILLIISVVFAVALAYEFQTRGDTLLALGMAGLTLFNAWSAYAFLARSKD